MARTCWQRSQNLMDQTAGLLQLVEAHSDACGDVPLGADDLRWRQHGVRVARQVGTQIEWLRTRASGQPDKPQTRGELRGDRAGADEPISYALVLVIDRAQREHLKSELA